MKDNICFIIKFVVDFFLVKMIKLHKIIFFNFRNYLCYKCILKIIIIILLIVFLYSYFNCNYVNNKIYKEKNISLEMIII